MTWTAPRTWVAGETVTASIMNTHVRDNLKAIGDPWVSYTPTLTNFTLGNGTMVAKSMQAGKYVSFYITIVFGSTSTFGTGWAVTLPAALLSAGEWRFAVGMKDASAAAQYLGTTYGTAGSSVSLASTGGAGGVISIGLTATNPFAWAVSDTLTVHGTYEAA